MAKRTFVKKGEKMVEQAVTAAATSTPVETPVVATTATTITTAEEPIAKKKDVLTAEAFSYRNTVWGTLAGAKLAAVRAATSLAAIVAKFGQENIPVGLTDDFRAFIASAVEGAGKPRPRQFTPEAWGLVSHLPEADLNHVRAGAFNGRTGVTLDEVLVALYLFRQQTDSKKGELDLVDGKPVAIVCGCGVCNGRKFVAETWLTGKGRVGNYVPGALLGSAERFVPVSRRCIGRINKAVFTANEPIAKENDAIAAQRKAGEKTEPFQAMKPMVYGLSASDAEKVLGREIQRAGRRQASDDRLASIVGNLKAPTKTGVGRGGEGGNARPNTRRGYRQGQESRF